jgi:hypothetical protein
MFQTLSGKSSKTPSLSNPTPGAYAHAGHTGLVQVVRQLDRRLHLRVHVGLEDAAAERCLVVGLLRLGLDGSLHPALGDVRGDGAQGLRVRPASVHVIRLQVLGQVDGHDHSRDRVSDLGLRVGLRT